MARMPKGKPRPNPRPSPSLRVVRLAVADDCGDDVAEAAERELDREREEWVGVDELRETSDSFVPSPGGFLLG